ncbi:MAG: ABC transporter permease [Myxococcales bacterium]|nr:ABC transporter permease [Myxococcales bacterium]
MARDARSKPEAKAPLSERHSPRASLRIRAEAFFIHFGQVGRMTADAFAAIFQRPFELRETLYQMEALGVRSLGIASVVALFTGLVMATQFAYGLQKFGGMEYTGRIVGLSFARELAPSLTAVVVGGRIGSGITAEIGSMAVTEQIDAIRALGADPIKKLVVPRLIASIIIMPILACFALVLGFAGAMYITDAEFGLPAGFFLQTALESVRFADFFSGLFKTPFFGAITALVGCHYGFTTRGGTQGVGDATTRSVVAISIAILISDFVLTKVTMVIWPQV